MEKFEFNLNEMEELDVVESSWYVLFGSGFLLVCD